MLGAVELRRDGAPLHALLAQPKRLALLAYLAAADRAESRRRDTLLALFWPELPEDRARNALKQAVHHLRRAVGEGAIPGHGDELTLDPAVVRADVAEFGTALADRRPADALALYCGELMPGFHVADAPGFERWLERRRAQLRESAASAAWSCAATSERAGDLVAASTSARRALELRPLDEPGARRLILLLDQAGDRAGALAFYREFERRLADELESTPEPATAALAQALRTGTHAVATAPPRDGLPVGGRPVAPAAGALVDVALRAPATAAPAAVVATAIPTPSRPRAVRLGAVVVGAAALLAGAAAIGTRTTHSYVAGRAERLTSAPELEVDGTISPDGRFVAYAAGASGHMRVHVRQVSGGRAVALAPDLGGDQRWPRWSPDGARILFGAHGALHVAPALGGAARRVAEPHGRGPLLTPAWSPDGRAIAYVDELGVWQRPLDGGPPRLLARGLMLHSPAYSPDGRRLAYVAGNQNYVGSTNFGNLATSALWTVPAAGGAATQVTDARHLSTSPIWTPDGRSLLYVANGGGTRDVYQQPMRADGSSRGVPRRITTGLDPYTISLSADGSRLGYSVIELRSNVWSAPIAERGPTPVSHATPVTLGNRTVESFDLSPDGRWLALSSDQGGERARLYKLRLDASPADSIEPVQLTHGDADDFAPTWSPDGHEIAFHRLVGGHRDLVVTGADGAGPVRTIALPSQELNPDWSPDGRRLAFVSWATGRREVYLVSRLDAGHWSAARRLTDEDGVIQYVAFAPDGRHVAYVRHGTLRLVPADGGDTRAVVDLRAAGLTVTYPAFGPDPYAVYFQTVGPDGTRAFWSAPLDGGAPRLLLALDDPTRHSRRPSFVTDGRRLLFTVASDDADVWVMELR